MNRDTVEVKTTAGNKIEITLEDWVELIIDKALEKHKVKCPFDVDKCGDRVKKLEWQMGIVKWVGLTISTAAIAHIFYTIMNSLK